MALSAGRKGVAASQVDSLGKIKGIDIPIASPTKAGTVKPVSKTAGMTQDVGIDSNGKLYTAPSTLLHEYSTTEKEVGKWVDGKTIYEKVVRLENNSGSVGVNIDTLIYLDARGTDTGHLWTKCGVSSGSHYLYYDIVTSTIICVGTAADYAIIQYTKGE